MTTEPAPTTPPDLDFDFDDVTIKRGATARYRVPHLRDKVLIDTLPASANLNPAWFSDWLRSPRHKREMIEDIGADEIARRLDEDRVEHRRWTLAHLIRDWSGVISRTGQAVPYSPAAAKVWIGKLPDHIFDAFYAWVQHEANFMPSSISRAAVESLAKN